MRLRLVKCVELVDDGAGSFAHVCSGILTGGLGEMPGKENPKTISDWFEYGRE